MPISPDQPMLPASPVPGYVLTAEKGVDGRGPDVRCSARSTAGSLAMYRTVVDGHGPPLHQHTHEDETIHVLDGTMEVTCGEERWAGGPGTTFFMPRGLAHTFRSVEGPAEILFIITPGRLDEFFRRREELEDPADVAALMREYL